MKKNKIVCGVFLFLLLFLIVFLFFSYKQVEGLESNNTIPKKIWTFWDSETVPDVVEKCIDTWKKNNPKYEIIILNKSNLKDYLDVDFSKIKHIDNSPEKYSDMVRLHILAKYGGVWSDASVICLKSYDTWIPYMQERSGAEFVGFYIDSFTLPEFKESSPVIENWFFACTTGSIMVNEWLNEFLRISDYDTVEKYVEAVKSEGVNIQNISSPTYLSMHVACQKVLQKGENRPYKFAVLKAEDTAFKYLTKNDWNSEKAVKNILDCKNESKEHDNCNFLDSQIIKMRGVERNQMEKLNYSDFFL